MTTENERNETTEASGVASSDLFGYMPTESGYYWVFFEGVKYAELGYLNADDLLAGSRSVRFITGQRIWHGNPFLNGSIWFKIPQPSSPNVKVRPSLQQQNYEYTKN